MVIFHSNSNKFNKKRKALIFFIHQMITKFFILLALILIVRGVTLNSTSDPVEIIINESENIVGFGITLSAPLVSITGPSLNFYPNVIIDAETIVFNIQKSIRIQSSSFNYSSSLTMEAGGDYRLVDFFLYPEGVTTASISTSGTFFSNQTVMEIKSTSSRISYTNVTFSVASITSPATAINIIGDFLFAGPGYVDFYSNSDSITEGIVWTAGSSIDMEDVSVTIDSKGRFGFRAECEMNITRSNLWIEFSGTDLVTGILFRESTAYVDDSTINLIVDVDESTTDVNPVIGIEFNTAFFDFINSDLSCYSVIESTASSAYATGIIFDAGHLGTIEYDLNYLDIQTSVTYSGSNNNPIIRGIEVTGINFVLGSGIGYIAIQAPNNANTLQITGFHFEESSVSQLYIEVIINDGGNMNGNIVGTQIENSNIILSIISSTINVNEDFSGSIVGASIIGVNDNIIGSTITGKFAGVYENQPAILFPASSSIDCENSVIEGNGVSAQIQVYGDLTSTSSCTITDPDENGDTTIVISSNGINVQDLHILGAPIEIINSAILANDLEINTYGTGSIDIQQSIISICNSATIESEGDTLGVNLSDTTFSRILTCVAPEFEIQGFCSTVGCNGVIIENDFTIDENVTVSIYGDGLESDILIISSVNDISNSGELIFKDYVEIENNFNYSSDGKLIFSSGGTTSDINIIGDAIIEFHDGFDAIDVTFSSTSIIMCGYFSADNFLSSSPITLFCENNAGDVKIVADTQISVLFISGTAPLTLECEMITIEDSVSNLEIKFLS